MTLNNNQLNIFKIVAEFSSDCLMWFLDDNTIKYISPAVETITGYESQEFIDNTKLFKQLIHPEDKAYVLQEFEDEFNKPHTNSIQFRIIHKDGSTRWVAHRCRPVYDDNKEIIGRVSSNRDITTREIAVQDMLKMTRIVEQSTEAVAIVDANFNTEYVNSAFEKMTGYSLAEVQEINQRSLKSDKQYREFYKEIFDTIAKENIWHGQNSSQKKNGTTYYVDSVIFPLKDESGRIMNYAKTSRDITEQKELENSLQKQEELLRTLINATPDIICFKDGQGRWLEANDADLKLFELDNVDYRGKKDSELAQYSAFYYDAFMACEASDEISWEKGDLSRGIETIPRADGSEKVYDVIKVPLFESDGSRKGLVVFGRDITEMKQVEKTLKQSEDRLSKIMLASNDGMWDWNLKTNEVYFDPRYYEMAGYSVDEFPHSLEEFQKRIHPDYSDTVMNQAQMHLNGEIDRFNVEFLFKKKNGHWMWILGRGVIVERDEQGVPLRFVGTHTDITGLKKVSEALRESEEKYRRIFEESQDAIFVSSAEGRVLDINPAGLQLFGYSSLDEISKINIAEEYINPEDRRKYQQRFLEKGFIKDYELHLKKKDGSELIVIENSTAIYDVDNNIIGCRGIMRDITEKKNLENQLAQAQKLETVGTMVGGISHELNNILQSIFLYGGLVQENLPAEQEIQTNMKHLLENGERAKDIVKQILTFSRKSKVDLKPQPLYKLVLEVLSLEQASFPANIEIKQNIDITDDLVLCDKTQIHQIILNLCNNAEHAMREKGGILSVRLKHTCKPIHDGDPATDAIALTISDTGHGIDPVDLERVFDPFFTTKQFGQGTGLGLSVIYGIVNMMDGHISVSSEVDQGTTFKILLPVVKTEEASQLTPKSKEQSDNFKKSILLVDDQDSIRILTEKILTRKGFLVTSAADGKQALEIFKANPGKFDVIVTDQSMPTISGSELTREVRNSQSDIPIILSTGRLGAEYHKEFKDIGITGFIQKPWTANELIDVIQEIAND